MRNPEQTIGKMIDKSKTSYIAYVDEEGFPITKAMLQPREREGITVILSLRILKYNYLVVTHL